MSDYAVVNPATGETVATYPTISDDELKAAIGRAERSPPDLERLVDGAGARRADPPRRRAAHREAPASRRDHRA